MIDNKKKERFFSSFTEFEKNILAGYVNTLSSSKADIYLVMARKATCLIEALIELGSLSLNGKVYSERILDLGKDFLISIFKDKSVIVVDDTIVSGTTISDVTKTILNYGAKQVSIEVITVNKKWYAPELLKARLEQHGKSNVEFLYSKPVELMDNDSINFCFDIVKGLSILPKLYDYDFPRIKLQKWKEQALSSLLINDMGWKYFDCSTKFQNKNGICAYTCIPSEHTIEEFNDYCGTNLSEIANYKIRFLGYKNDNGNYNLTAVPMIIFNVISKENIDNYFNILIQENSTETIARALFTSYVSRFRFLQYVLSIKLMNFWMKHVKAKFGQDSLFDIRNYVDENVETMLFSDIGNTIMKSLDYSQATPYFFEKNDIYSKENFESVLPNVEEDYIIKGKIIEPFIDFYDKKELPCRTAVKEYDYHNFSENEFLECINNMGAEYGRLKHGITFTELSHRISYLSGKYDYITYTSVFLDKLISRGIAVPIIQEDERCLYRAYRHGEDAIMGDMEHRIVAWILKSISNHTKTKQLTKITTEKLIALLIKFGVREGWIDTILDDKQSIENHKIVVSNKHDLHGMRPQATKCNFNEFRTDPWYTYYLERKGYINKEKHGYSFNPPVDFNPEEYSKGANDILSFSIVFGEVIKNVCEHTSNFDDFNWQITKLASCIFPKDLLDALVAEIKIFRSYWINNAQNFDYSQSRKSEDFNKAKTAINSGQLKYYAYKNNEAKEIVENIASSLSDKLYSNIFKSFFDLREGDSLQKYHEELIDILGCWIVTMNLAIRLFEFIHHLGTSPFNAFASNKIHEFTLDYLEKILKNNDELLNIGVDTYYETTKENFDIKENENIFKSLSDVLSYVYKVSFFLNGYNIPKHLVCLTEQLLKESLSGTQAKEKLYILINELNNRILNQIKKAEWEIDNYNKVTERKLYKNCIYIKFYRRNPEIIKLIDKFLIDSTFQNGNFPYVIKTQDSIFDDENDICIAYYENDKNEIKPKIISFLKKLKHHIFDIERLFAIQKLPPQYSIEVIKNSIDAMPFVHAHNLMDLINKLIYESSIKDTWLFEVAFDNSQKLRLNNIIGKIEFEKEENIEQMNLSIYRKEKLPKSKVKFAIVTVLDEEYNAVYRLLEEPYEECFSSQGAGHTYVIGKIPSANHGYHIVALCQCSGMGNNMSSIKVTQLLTDFKNIDYIFMTGIAAGSPNINDPEKHVRLGDVVVSDKSGVIQYDMIKITESGIEHRNVNIASNSRLLEACRKLRRDHNRKLDEVIFADRLTPDTDIIYDSEGNVVSHPVQSFRDSDKPCLFIGNIGSANILLKHSQYRDELISKFNLMAFEMEGSGIADASWQGEVGYLIVRGISDYGDSNKNDIWHEYAAAVAASATCAILQQLLP